MQEIKEHISKKLTPLIRFEEFTTEWSIKECKDLFINSRTKGHEGLPIYSVTLNRGMIPRDTLKRKTENASNANDNLFVAKNDISYNMMRMWQGAFGLSPEDCMVSAAYVVLHPKEEVSTDFFIRHFNRSRSLYLFTAYSYGLTSDRLRLYYKDFGRIRFNTPSLPEQQKIASFLSAVDEKIQQLTKKKELLEQYKKGVMQQLFSGQLRFKDVNGDEYPDWEESSVIDIADKKVKWSFTGGPFGSDLKSDDYTETGIRVIQLQNIGDGIFHNKSKIYTSIEKADQLLACNIFAGEMILSKMGDPVARACMIPETDERWLMCSDGIRYVVDENKVNKIYLFEYINSSFFRKKALALSTGSTRKRIGLTELKKIKINHPCLSEQTKIGILLDSLGKNIESVNNQITQTQTFKKGLLQQMFV